MSKVRVAVLDRDNGLKEAYVDDNDLNSFYELIKADCFDVTCRFIEDTEFDIYVDDEGLFRSLVVPTAFNEDMQPVLVGNLLFAHHDAIGNTTAISDEDYALIEKHVILMTGMLKNSPSKNYTWYSIVGVSP